MYGACFVRNRSLQSKPLVERPVCTIHAVFQLNLLAQNAKKKNQNTNVFWFFLVRWKGLEPPAY